MYTVYLLIVIISLIISLHHLQQNSKNSFWHVTGRGYNKNCVLYPRPLMCQKEFLLFYTCELWALHVVIKLQFFTFIIILLYIKSAT